MRTISTPRLAECAQFTHTHTIYDVHTHTHTLILTCAHTHIARSTYADVVVVTVVALFSFHISLTNTPRSRVGGRLAAQVKLAYIHLVKTLREHIIQHMLSLHSRRVCISEAHTTRHIDTGNMRPGFTVSRYPGVSKQIESLEIYITLV